LALSTAQQDGTCARSYPCALRGRCGETGVGVGRCRFVDRALPRLTDRESTSRRVEGKKEERERERDPRRSAIPPSLPLSYSSSAPQIALRAGSCSAGFSAPVAPAARSWGRQGQRREFCSSPFVSFSVTCRTFFFFISFVPWRERSPRLDRTCARIGLSCD
jgi:hypothetical protein